MIITPTTGKTTARTIVVVWLLPFGLGESGPVGASSIGSSASTGVSVGVSTGVSGSVGIGTSGSTGGKTIDDGGATPPEEIWESSLVNGAVSSGELLRSATKSSQSSSIPMNGDNAKENILNSSSTWNDCATDGAGHAPLKTTVKMR